MSAGVGEAVEDHIRVLSAEGDEIFFAVRFGLCDAKYTAVLFCVIFDV